VTVYELEVSAFDPGPHPQATLEVRCSAGTYVRTLVHDLGEQLGCGAHLTWLRRTEAGGFTEGDAVQLEHLDATSLRPLEDIVKTLVRLDLDEGQARTVGFGARIPAPASAPEGELRALFSEGRLVAVYRRAGEVLKAETVVGDLALRQ
jgi:tRNA pseudouridine55 synthase